MSQHGSCAQCQKTVRHWVLIKAESEVQRTLQITDTPWQIKTDAVFRKKKLKCLIISLLWSREYSGAVMQWPIGFHCAAVWNSAGLSCVHTCSVDRVASAQNSTSTGPSGTPTIAAVRECLCCSVSNSVVTYRRCAHKPYLLTYSLTY